MRGAVTEVNSPTLVGLGYADPPAGFRRLYALLRRRFTPASLRSAAQAQATPNIAFAVSCHQGVFHRLCTAIAQGRNKASQIQ